MAISAASITREDWITPEEQFERFTPAPIARELSKQKECSSDIANIIALYAAPRLSNQLTNWYTALERLDALPDRIPALPWNIDLILDSECPIYSDERKRDGTPYKVAETHSLYLIPSGTLDDLEARVSAYGQSHLAEYNGQNPLRFKVFWPSIRPEDSDIQLHEPQWILISNDVLPGSRKQSYQRQAEMVAELSEKAYATYEVPTLQCATAAIFLHKIATGRSIYKQDSMINSRNPYTFTRVEETIEGPPYTTRVGETMRGPHLFVGGFSPSGVYACHDCSRNSQFLGVAALRKF